MIIARSKSALLLCTAVTLLAANSMGVAQETASETNGVTVLERITIKGKRVQSGNAAGNAASDTPLASTTTAEDLRKKEINNARDLGNTTEPGVEYSETKPGRPGGLFIRGLGGARVTTLIDGIPAPYFGTVVRSGMFSPTTALGDGSNSFDFSSLSRVDVVRGADASRIGPGALGGALVLRTLEPEDLIEEGRDWGGVAKLTYDSDDRSIGGSIAVAKKIQNTSVLFQGAYKKGHERDNQGTDDIYGTRRTEANPADYDQDNLMFKIRQDLEGGHRIGLTAERFNLDSTTDLKTFQTTTAAGTGGQTFTPGDYWGRDDLRRERLSLDYNYEAQSDDALIDAATLTAYWQRVTKNAGSHGVLTTAGGASGLNYLRDNTAEESSFGLTGNAVSTFDAMGFNHEVRFGGTLQFSKSEEYLAGTGGSATTLNKSDMPDIDGKKLGLYLDDRIAVDGSAFALTPGLRFDWYDYDPQTTSTYTGTMPEGQDGYRLSPKLLATYDLTPETQLFAQWSMSYRAPTVDELYTYFGNGYLVQGNASLKPETGNGFELGANYETNDLSGKLTVFHNRYSNFIEAYSQTPLYYTWRNRSKVEISGVEVKARQDFVNGIFLHGSLAYAYGKDADTGEVLRSVAPFKAIVGIGYDQESWGVDLTTIISAGMRKDEKATSLVGAAYDTFDAPGYGVVNLTGWWEPEQTKGLRVQAGIYNVFDKTYYNGVALRDLSTSSVATYNQPAAFYSEPGRTFKISLTQKF